MITRHSVQKTLKHSSSGHEYSLFKSLLLLCEHRTKYFLSLTPFLGTLHVLSLHRVLSKRMSKNDNNNKVILVTPFTVFILPLALEFAGVVLSQTQSHAEI